MTIIEVETITETTNRNSGDMPSFSDTVFGFLDENYPSLDNSSEDTFKQSACTDDEEEEEENEENCDLSEGTKAFWDEQEKLLDGILRRTSSIESRVRNSTKEGLKKVVGTINCDCFLRDVKRGGCRDCLRQGMFDHLCNSGFPCLIQKSKWKSCHDIRSGKLVCAWSNFGDIYGCSRGSEHTYLEVVDKSSPNKGEVKVVIELNFRAEFEMVKASQEYNRLIKKLPQVYVGKQERLRSMVKILCVAAKKCMKEKKMHLAPWRKHKYMHAKWLSNCSEFIYTKTIPTMIAAAAKHHDRRLMKPRASLLTQSLTVGLSQPHCQTVKVI